MLSFVKKKIHFFIVKFLSISFLSPKAKMKLSIYYLSFKSDPFCDESSFFLISIVLNVKQYCLFFPDVPNVKISFDPIFKFGSKATITTEVSSNPSPEKLEWQKSKNGIEFHCIDIKNPKYYGSSEEAECPMLVILEIDFADKLHYRLVVWNIFGESISNTVFLDVKGSTIYSYKELNLL